MSPWSTRMICCPVVTFFIVLEVMEGILAQDAGRQRTVLRTSKDKTPPLYKPGEQSEWTTWFNVDHPGGKGDYEQLDAIRFYYANRVCESPIALQARTTTWVPASNTGEVVHSDPAKGFWCANAEQPAGRNCSNYAVRFLCPKGILGSVVQRAWGLWSDWSQCPAPCGQMAVQARSRNCNSHSRHWEQHCAGPAVESRVCKGPACQECALHCVMGKVNAECSTCHCEDHLILGSVLSAGGLPAPGAVLHRAGNTQELLAVTDHNGHFRLLGICPDGNTTLVVQLQRHLPLNFVVPLSAARTSVLHLTLKRQENLHMLSHPEDKARRVGQMAAFCCKVSGKPGPNQYQWFHNGTLLDNAELQYDSTLVLRNIRFDQAGDYYCRASNKAGAIKSKPAKLKVIGHEESSCNAKPQTHLVQLPHDCFQNKSRPLYYNVGKCPPGGACVGQLDNLLRCKDSEAYCCGVVKTEMRQISCQGYQLPIIAATQCGCKKCVDTKAILRGQAVAADNGEPLRFGHIFMNDVRVSRTGYRGTFSIPVPLHTERLVLTFVDHMHKFVNTTKVLAYNKKGGSVYHKIKLFRKKEPMTLQSSEANTIQLGEVHGQDPIAELQIPSHAFYQGNGEVFMGNVTTSVTFFDPRDMKTVSAAQSDLNFVDEEGDIVPLRTYGMFSVDFRDSETGRPLNLGKVQVLLDLAQVKMPEHINEMKLWSLNPNTGLWEHEGDFYETKIKRRKREERTFLIGNMEIRERRLFNIDVPERRRCYVKVRTFRSERFMPSEQVEGVVVTLINAEPSPGFSSNPRAWGRFDSVITSANGACLPGFCDDQRADAYSAFVTATLGGEELEAAASSTKFKATGIPESLLSNLNYRRTDHDDPRLKKTAFSINVVKPNPNRTEESNGPIYALEHLKECEEAPFSAGHFRFYRVEGAHYDYNTVPFNEDDPMSWTAHYLSWWPKPMEYRACYIKVKLNGPHEINVRSQNMGGTHPQTTGKLYGIRDSRSTRDMKKPNVSAVCLEFKCSGMLYDQDRVDRTLVKVIPQGNCKRDNVGSLLQQYLVNHLPLAVNNDTSEFTMLAPLDPLGHNYGIYTVTDQDPRTAKEIALGRCFDGSSDGSSRVMKTNEGVALTFTCAHREVTRQSTFQTIQNFPRQSLVRSMWDRRRSRRRWVGLAIGRARESSNAGPTPRSIG